MCFFHHRHVLKFDPSMDRTAEYNSFLAQEDIICNQAPYKDKFFDVIIANLCNVEANLVVKKSYSQILALERNFNALVKESTELLNAIEMEGSCDETTHFEGIKQIIKLKVADIAIRIQKKKQNMISYSASLEPEKPILFAREGQPVFEEENQRLVERFRSRSTELSTTRKQLIEIESIQDLIKIHLTEQDERIDSIVSSTKSAKKSLTHSNTYFSKGRSAGSLTRRILFVFTLCASFVLAFSYVFYR